MLCTEASKVKHYGFGLTIEPLYCKRWSCDICMPRNLLKLRAIANRGAPDTFITLTTNVHRYDEPGPAARDLVDAWRTIRRRALKKYGYASIPFLAIFEDTKQGWPHLHILARCPWLDQKWLSKQMQGLTGAPIVDIRRVSSRRLAAWYVSKYISKRPEKHPGTQRYWRSKDWSPPDDYEKEAISPWNPAPERRDDRASSIAYRYEQRGHLVTYCKGTYLVLYNWPNESLGYAPQPPPTRQ